MLAVLLLFVGEWWGKGTKALRQHTLTSLPASGALPHCCCLQHLWFAAGSRGGGANSSSSPFAPPNNALLLALPSKC